jgi:hypothetical protein
MIAFRVCTRAKVVSSARFCSPRRRLKLSAARLLHLNYSWCTYVSACAIAHYTTSSDIHLHPSVVLQLLSRPPQWLAPTKSGGFSGGQLLLAS